MFQLINNTDLDLFIFHMESQKANISHSCDSKFSMWTFLETRYSYLNLKVVRFLISLSVTIPYQSQRSVKMSRADLLPKPWWPMVMKYILVCNSFVDGFLDDTGDDLVSELKDEGHDCCLWGRADHHLLHGLHNCKWYQGYGWIDIHIRFQHSIIATFQKKRCLIRWY